MGLGTTFEGCEVMKGFEFYLGKGNFVVAAGNLMNGIEKNKFGFGCNLDGVDILVDILIRIRTNIQLLASNSTSRAR